MGARLIAVDISPDQLAAVQSTRIFGRCCFVGEGGDFHVEPSPDIIHRHLTLVGSRTFSTYGLEESAGFTARRSISLDSLITGRCDIEGAPAAYERFAAGAPGKFVINWD